MAGGGGGGIGGTAVGGGGVVAMVCHWAVPREQNKAQRHVPPSTQHAKQNAASLVPWPLTTISLNSGGGGGVGTRPKLGGGGGDLIKKTDKCKPEAMHSTVKASVHLDSLCQTRLTLKTHAVSETENRTSCLTTLVRQTQSVAV